jgi:ubiquinone/menaquinone biosynthesis C-methylase UbiE
VDKDRQNKEKKFWDRFAKKYDPFMKSVEPAYDLLIGKINPYLDASKDVLEVAAGTGMISLKIAPHVNKVWGCDLSPEMIKVAKKKLKRLDLTNARFTVQDAYHLDYERGIFDVVIASNALHIMIHPERALASIRQVLKPDGIFIAPTLPREQCKKPGNFSHHVTGGV